MLSRLTARTARLMQGAAACAAPLLILSAAGTAHAAPSDDTVEHAVTFTVQNTNTTAIECSTDGATYQIRGHIVGPASALRAPQAVTLFLHGLSYGEFFTEYDEQAGYNFADKQAADGHVTVTIDRLGYDASDRPTGQDVCLGSQADVAHQIVQELKSGDFTTDGATSAAFSEVVLAGHSVGGLIAQVEAYTYSDTDGLMVLSYSDTDVSPAAKAALLAAVAACELGGDPADGNSGPDGYVYFGADTPEMFVAAHFYTPNADPAVVDATAAMRNRDPCGDIQSYQTAVTLNLAHIAEITVPALVLTGGEDAIYPVPADKQASLLTGSDDVTPVTIAATRHALTLHNSADEFQGAVSSWLVDHDFGGMVPPDGPVDTGAGGTSTPDNLYLGLGGALLLLGAGVAASARGTGRASSQAR